MDACFGFGEVMRNKRKMMNPKNSAYVKTDKFNVKVADFYMDSLASFFNCKETNRYTLSCNYGMLIHLKTKNLTENRYPISVELTDKQEWRKIKNLICKELRNSTCIETNETKEMKKMLNLSEICACKDLKITLFNNTLFYG